MSKTPLCIKCTNPLVIENTWKYCNYRYCERFGLLTVVEGVQS